jgi:hypothetical protein
MTRGPNRVRKMYEGLRPLRSYTVLYVSKSVRSCIMKYLRRYFVLQILCRHVQAILNPESVKSVRRRAW